MPSARCENLNCRATLVAATAEELFEKALAHHRNNKTENLIISLLGSRGTKDSHHACRDFEIFDDAEVSLGKWHFANDQYSDMWSTATLLTGRANTHHRFDRRDRGDRTENRHYYERSKRPRRS